jgi:hypothetical protein
MQRLLQPVKHFAHRIEAELAELVDFPVLQ